MDPVTEAPGAVSTDGIVGVPDAAIPVVPDQTPEVTTPPQDGQQSIPSEVAIYQDVVSKYNADPSYEMTDEEVGAFLAVQDKINSGELKEPPPKGIKLPDPDKKTIPENEPTETDEGENPLTDSVSDAMMKAMEKVGAKDVTELPEKIQSLINSRDSTGGRLGAENKSLQEAVEQLKAKATRHQEWLNDLKNGVPEAIEFLHQKVGYKPGAAPAPRSDNVDPDLGIDLDSLDPDDFVDDKLAKIVIGQQKLIKQQADVIAKQAEKDKAREQEFLNSQAVTAWVDDVVALVTDPKNLKHYGLTPTEARGLTTQYFDKKNASKPVHPKMQKVHELIKYANDKKMPSLDVAHIMLMHEGGSYAKEVIEAEKRGQQTVNHKPSVNGVLSEQQSRQGNNVPEPTITDDVLDRIERGSFDEIPDSWMDETGNLIPDRVPRRFHTRVFGQKAGMPK